MKNRILLCSPYKGAVGGIQRWTNHIIKYTEENVDDETIDINFYCLSRKASLVSPSSVFNRLLAGLLEYPFLINGFVKEIKKKKFDIIHITSSASISLLKDLIMLSIAKRRGIKTIIHFRFGRIPELYAKKNWEYKLLHRVIKLANMTIVLDESSYFILRKEGYKAVTLLPNPIAPEIHQIIQHSLNIKRNERKIVFVGHVVETKGVFELIEVCKNINNIELKLIGPITKEIELRIDELVGTNNSWLIIAGELGYEEIIREMLSAGVFVLPTYTEGFPNVILESMACGCPIVASKVGAIPEMLNIGASKECGITVEPKNVHELSRAIMKMLNDSEFARYCGFNARERVNDEYSMPIVWNQMTNIWKNVNN